jgi:hypothetical protein
MLDAVWVQVLKLLLVELEPLLLGLLAGSPSLQ